MSEMDRILDQLVCAYQGPAWSGPCVREVLDGVDAATADRRPIAGAHTIAELVEHITAWEDIVRRRFLGETVNVTDELDWPQPATGASGWVRTLERLDRGHHALREVVRAFPAARLDEISSDGRRSFYVLIHGVVQHDLYHAGQIAVLRKG